jgi:TetR/AcrR family transcriptional repressor of nem operon
MPPRNTATRDQLIDSTRKLLWERGYAATSPRAILDRAGVGQGSMYHYFSGKEELAGAALDITAQTLLDQAIAVLCAEGSAFDRVSAYLLRQRDVLCGCPLGRMVGDADVLASPALRDVLAVTFDRVRVLVAGVLEQGVAAGEFAPAVDPAALADTVLAVVQGGYVLARAAGNADPFDRAVRGAVSLIALARAQPRS